MRARPLRWPRRHAWWLALGSMGLASLALADSFRRGEVLGAETTPQQQVPGAIEIQAGAAVLALEAHDDGRILVLTGRDLSLYGADGARQRRIPLAEAANHALFGPRGELALIQQGGVTTLSAQGSHWMEWQQSPQAVASALPNGGFVFGRAAQLRFTDGAGHELRRLSLPNGAQVQQLRWGQRGLWALTQHAKTHGLYELGHGERSHLHAAMRGEVRSARLEDERAQLVTDDGSMIELSPRGLRRWSSPGHALVPLHFGLGVVAIQARPTLVEASPTDSQVLPGAAFGTTLTQTDAGMVLPTLRAARLSASAPLWLVLHDQLLRAYKADAIEPVDRLGCSAHTLVMVAGKGRVVVACQERVRVYLD